MAILSRYFSGLPVPVSDDNKAIFGWSERLFGGNRTTKITAQYKLLRSRCNGDTDVLQKVFTAFEALLSKYNELQKDKAVKQSTQRQILMEQDFDKELSDLVSQYKSVIDIELLKKKTATKTNQPKTDFFGLAESSSSSSSTGTNSDLNTKQNTKSENCPSGVQTNETDPKPEVKPEVKPDKNPDVLPETKPDVVPGSGADGAVVVKNTFFNRVIIWLFNL